MANEIESDKFREARADLRLVEPEPEPLREVPAPGVPVIRFDFQKGEPVDLNGVALKIAFISEKEVILSRRGGKAKGVQKAIQVGAQFEWKSWAFRVTKIQGGLVHIQPFAINRDAVPEEPLAQLEGAPVEAPAGFVIDPAQELPGIGNVAEFVQKIIEDLQAPNAPDPMRGAWAQGVKGFFEGLLEAQCPWDDSAIIRLDERDADRHARLSLARFWKLGWGQAYGAALLAWRRVQGLQPMPPPNAPEGTPSGFAEPEVNPEAIRAMQRDGEDPAERARALASRMASQRAAREGEAAPDSLEHLGETTGGAQVYIGRRPSRGIVAPQETKEGGA